MHERAQAVLGSRKKDEQATGECMKNQKQSHNRLKLNIKKKENATGSGQLE